VMQVTIIFDPEFGARSDADVGDAFWMVDSTGNRALADRLWASGSTDHNSAVFRAQGDEPDDDAVRERFEDVELHHPTWTTVRFVGVGLSDELRDSFLTRGLSVAPESRGFVVGR